MNYFNIILVLRRIYFGVLFWLISIPIFPQANSTASLPQYLYPVFSTSNVKFKSGKSQTVLLNYNLVTEKMVFKKDDKLMDMINIEIIDTIFIGSSKFVPDGGIFHEVVIAAPVSLFIQHKAKLLPGGQPAAYGGTSQTSSTQMTTGMYSESGYYNFKLPADFIVKIEPVYWVRKDNKMYSFENKGQFLKIFPDKSAEIDKYIKQNHIKIDNPSQLNKLIGYCNELVNPRQF
jgi:hypothetical protein